MSVNINAFLYFFIVVGVLLTIFVDILKNFRVCVRTRRSGTSAINKED